jgi:hypothetical protein
MEPSITEINRQKRAKNEAAAKALRDELYARSPLGAFKGRMDAIQDVPNYMLPRGQNITGSPMSGPAVDTGGGSLKYDDSMWEGDTNLPNRRAGKVRVMSDAAMTPEQRQQIYQAAMADYSPEPLRGSINGQNFSMPASGPRVSEAKAKGFLDLARQGEQARIAREQIALERQRADEDRARRVKMEDEALAETKRKTARVESQQDLERRRQDFREEQERKQAVFAALLNATKDPAKRAEIMNDMYGNAAAYAPAPIGGMGLTGVADAARSAAAQAGARRFTADPLEVEQYKAGLNLGTAKIGTESKQAMAAVGRQPAISALENDPQLRKELMLLKQEIESAGNLPWYHDVGNAALSVIGQEGYGADAAKIGGIKDRIVAVAKEAAARNGVDPKLLMDLITTEILSKQVPDMAAPAATEMRRAFSSPFPQ